MPVSQEAAARSLVSEFMLALKPTGVRKLLDKLVRDLIVANQLEHTGTAAFLAAEIALIEEVARNMSDAPTPSAKAWRRIGGGS